MRPDLVVHMPDARDLVIDAKTPLDAYLAALEAPTDEERAAGAAASTRSRWRRGCVSWPPRATGRSSSAARSSPCCSCRAISSSRPRSPSGPSSSRGARAERDHCHALDAHGAAEGGRLRLAPVGRGAQRRADPRPGPGAAPAPRHLPRAPGRMGQRLGAAVEAYNAAVGSLERQVLPQARRFHDLGVTADAPLAPLEPIGQLVRSSERARRAAEVPLPPRADRARAPHGRRPDTARARSRLALLPAPQRPALEALFGIEAEIRASPAPRPRARGRARAPGLVARGMPARCAPGTPLHPLTRALRALFRRNARRAAQRARAASWISRPGTWPARPSRRAASWPAYCERWSAALVAPWRRSRCPPRAPARSSPWAARLHELELLVALARMRAPGGCACRWRSSTRPQVAPRTCAAAVAARARPRWCVRGIGRPVRRWRQRSRARPPRRRPALRGLLVWAALASGTRARVLAPCPTRARRATITPPLDGWRAWRAARRAARGQLRLAPRDFEE